MLESELLIVEDEGLIAESLKQTLHDHGFQVVGQTGRGREAIDMALYTQPDVIIMDIRLSGSLSGVDAARRIQKEADIPIVYLTAYKNDEITDDADDTWHVGFVTKPIRENDLLSRIEQAVQEHQKGKET